MKNVCIITSHPFWSEPLGCGSLMRSRYELLTAISTSLRVIFITRSEEQCPLPNSGTLKVQGPFTEDHVDLLKRFVVREKITTCFFSYNIFDQLAASLPCHTVVEIHDVLHLRQQAFNAHGYEPPLKISKDEELESLGRFDKVLCINLDEARYLAGCGLAGVSYLPPSVPFNPVPGPAGRPWAGLIGSSAIPNVDGLQHALGFIARLPHVVIAGGISDDPMLDAIADARIERLGVLPDVRAFYARINVALSPVRFGGGLKIKVFEALASGKPVVATSHSVAGFPDGIASVVSVEDDFAAWNTALIERAAATSLRDIEGYFAENFSVANCRKLLQAVIA
jgi:glycosyltransferase involved in cell wall biosynthesis